MALATYADLVTSVGNWLKRDNLTAVIPDLIAMAEAAINRDLRIRAMEKEATGTLSGSALALPADAIEPKSMVVYTGAQPVRLGYVAPDAMQQYQGYSAFPRVFTLIGNNMVLAPDPDAAYSYSLLYYAKFDPLASSGTNWLLTNNPDVYLYGSLLQAAPYIHDDERLPVWQQLYAKAFESVQTADDRSGLFLMRARADVVV